MKLNKFLGASLILVALGLCAVSHKLNEKTVVHPGAEKLVRENLAELADWKKRGMSPAEAAKRLNYYVSKFCKNEQPRVQDLDRLFETCRIACGGFVFVFSEIAKVFDLNARYVSILNLPAQGNHSLPKSKSARGSGLSVIQPTDVFHSFRAADG